MTKRHLCGGVPTVDIGWHALVSMGIDSCRTRALKLSSGLEKGRVWWARKRGTQRKNEERRKGVIWREIARETGLMEGRSRRRTVEQVKKMVG